MANQLSLFNTIYTFDCIAQHQHQRGLGAPGCLDQHWLMPCDDSGTLSHPKSEFLTGQRQTYTYASEALTYRTSGMTFPL